MLSRRGNWYSRFSWLPGGLLLIGAPSTWAQSPQAVERPLGLEEVIVTAQKREQRAQDVPIALDVFGAGQLEANGVSRLDDLGGKVAAVYFESINVTAPQVYIRGIGTQQYDNTTQGPVGIFVDDVYVAYFGGAPSNLFDVERVEILKGPQGTLYGRNTIAGAINIVTRDPTNEFEAEVQADYGNFDLMKVQAAMGGPLTTGLSSRVAVLASRRDGFTRNATTGAEANDDDTVAARAKLLWEPTERSVFDLSFDYNRNRLAGFDQKILGTEFVALGPGVFLFPPQADPDPDNVYVSYANVDGHQDRDLRGATLRASYDFERATLTSISAFNEHEWNGLRDLDGGPQPAFRMSEQQSGDELSQEVRLNSTGDSRLQWLIGAYYFRGSSQRVEEWLLDGFNFPFSSFWEGNYLWGIDFKESSYAAFGQVEYSITDRLDVIAGLRYADETKEGDFFTDFTPTDGVMPLFAFLVAPYTAHVERSWNSLDPSVTLNFHLTDDNIAYVSYKQGFKSGGFQLRPPDSLRARTPYGPEQVNVYEAGLKTKWLDDRLTANVAVFDYDYQDLQLLGQVSLGGLPTTITTNAGKATVQGVEVALEGGLLPTLQFGAGYAYLDAHYDDYVDPNGVQRQGNHLSRAPRNSVTAWTEYGVPMPGGNNLRLRVAYNWRDEIFTDPSNAEVGRGEAVGLLEGRISLELPGSGMTLSIWGSNLTEEVYCATVVPNAPPEQAVTCAVGAPRQYGLSASWSTR